MLRARIIPCLLIRQGGLVKTEKFKNHKYVGDPINAVKIFNEKQADELMVLDIDATVNKREPEYELIKNLATECRMPLCYGGGISTVEQAKYIIGLGVEKISISYAAIENPDIITGIAREIGSQSIVVVLDIKKEKSFFKEYYGIRSHNGFKTYKLDLIEFVKKIESAGAGEIIINSIDNDGVQGGYDIKLARSINSILNIPSTYLGGAGSLDDIQELYRKCGLVGAAAGSLFVFKGKFRAVLISYPNHMKKQEICLSARLTST